MTGLDPEWVVKVRELIRSKAKDSVILVSSHLLRELEAIIDSVTVIYYGRTLFSGSLEELNGILGRERKILLKTNDRNRACELIKEMGYECVLKEGWVEVSVSDSFQQKKIVKKLVEADVDVFELKSVETTLEEAYLRLLKGVKK